MSLKGKLQGNGQIDSIFMILKMKLTQGFICPCLGVIYMYITIIVKQVGYVAQMSGERLQDHWFSGHNSFTII